jgi:tetratricopeptide (TPR) repeat protein
LPFSVRFWGSGDEAILLRAPLGPLDADSATFYIVRAARDQNVGQPAVARAYFDSAAARLRRLLIQRPDDPELHANLAAALAGVGRVEEGLHEARRATELMPITRDQLANSSFVLVLTRIEVLAGRYDDAVAHLRALLSHPGAVSVGYLKASPEWAPLRARADFQQLLGPPGS